MNKTPRTDAQLKLEAFFDGIGIVETVEVEFARELEEELIEARARIDHLERIIDEMTEEQAALCAEDQSITELVAAKDKQLAEAQTEVDRLALEIENKQYTITCASEENQQLKESLADAQAEIEKQDTLLEKCLSLLKQQKERGE